MAPRVMQSAAAGVVAGLLLTLVPIVPAARAAQPHAAGGRGEAAAAPERIAGSDRIATAVALSHTVFRAPTPAVVLAPASGFADALAGGALAASLHAVVLLVPRDHLPRAVADELTRLEVPRVLAVGGDAVLGEAVLEEVRGLPHRPRVERLSGQDRWATAVAAADALGASAELREVVIASGQSFADGLAAGALLEGGEPRPLLLVAADHVPPATAAALRRLRPTRITVMGGRAAVSDAVVTALRRWSGEVERLAGADRYGTAIAALDEWHAREPDAPPRAVLVVGGESYPDGLAAAPAAAQLGAAVLLIPRRGLSDPLDAALRARTGRFAAATIIGGLAAVTAFAAEDAAAALAGRARPGFTGEAGPLPAGVRARMDGSSWRAGCPVGLDDLSFLRIRHWGFDGDAHEGELVVAQQHAAGLLEVFARLWAVDFPLAQMRLVDDFGADDDRSMAANNTSAFNCRTVAGTTRWSEHAYGAAVDVNPVQNPYVRHGRVAPEAGRAYTDRSDARPGMILDGSEVVDAFAAVGWGWGGHWRSSKDYQHFSASGH